MEISIKEDSGWTTSDNEWICDKCQVVIVQDEIDKCPICNNRKYIRKYKGKNENGNFTR